MTEIEKLEKEKLTLVEHVKKLEIERNKTLVRLAEIQGVIKYLNKGEDKHGKTL